MDFSFWVTTLIFPVLLVVASALMRLLVGAKQTALADVILAVIAFDLAVVIDNKTFVVLIQRDAIKENLAAIYMAFVLLKLVMWLWCVRVVEPKSARPELYGDLYVEDWTEAAVRYLWFFGGLAAVVMSAAFALAPFTLKLNAA